MTKLDLVRAAAASAAFSAFAGCGGLQTAVPGAGAASPYAEPGARPAARERAWMSPQAKNEDLLYVSAISGTVYVFTYPSGEHVGTLTGFSEPAGLCTDKAGNVWITDTPALAIVEYAHGGKKPIATLADFGFYPEGCAVDPTTGDLAVTNYASTLSLAAGSVSVFKNASGRPAIYANPAFNSFLFCGYDPKGNLYADGVDYGTYHSEFAELPAGSKKLRRFTLDKSFPLPGGVQWDGKGVAIEDMLAATVYRVKVSGSHGTVVGTTRLKGDRSTLLTQFWIDGKTIAVPYGTLSRRTKKVGLWPYPDGGSPQVQMRTAGASELIGVTVSPVRK